MNDSFRSDAFMRYNPEIIACACIFLAARVLQIPLPENPPWWEVFSASTKQITDIASSILRLYQMPKPDQNKLDRELTRLKEKMAKDKLLAKTRRVEVKEQANFSPSDAQTGSPNKSGTPTVRPLLSASELRKIKSEADINHRGDRNPHFSISSSRRDRDGERHGDKRSRDSRQPTNHDRHHRDRRDGREYRDYRSSQRDERSDKHRSDRKPAAPPPLQAAREEGSHSSPSAERSSSPPPPSHHHRDGRRHKKALKEVNRSKTPPKVYREFRRSVSPIQAPKRSPPPSAYEEQPKRAKRVVRSPSLDDVGHSRSASPGELSPIRVKKPKMKKISMDTSPQLIKFKKKHENRSKIRVK